eukprot:jgi/Ulvmu1/4973/UM207_0017.1
MSTQPAQAAPSKKDEKPSLAGVNVKTRKRNVAVPLDPSGFADSVLTLFKEHCDDADDITAKLAAANKALDTVNLDYSRYGVTLFEIYFAGARMGIGTKLVDDSNNKLDWNIFACAAEVDEILPFVKAFHGLVRRRPFLVQRLEEVLKKLLTSLEFFDNEGRKKIAIVTALVFTEKIGVLPERIFESMFNDRLVAKGTILLMVTDIFRQFIAITGSVDDLVVLLTKAKIANRLLEYFPPGQQTEAAFQEHFQKEGLDKLVQWQLKNMQEESLAQLEGELLAQFQDDAGVEAYIDTVKQHSGSIAAEDVTRVIWTVMIQSLNMIGKNQMQLLQMILKSMKTNKALLVEFTKSAKQELALLNCVQVTCYEDSKLLKIFVEIVKHLYETDILEEDTINFWYKKGSVTRGRNVFLNDIQPFIKWLEDAEEDDDEEDGE